MRCLSGVLMLAAALGLTGCVSGERAMRVKPDRVFERKIDFDSNNTNLWPFVYSENDRLAVLWPLFDKDSRGWALRPFYYRDNREQGVMFPLAAWNDRHGWAGNVFWGRDFLFVAPLYYQDQSHYWCCLAWGSRNGRAGGFFPLLNLQTIGVNWTGPVWWNRGGETEGGFFPLARFGSDGVNYAGPVWWRRGGETEGGFFPLARFGSDGINYAGPVWWDRTAHDYGFFPLVRAGGEGTNYAGPVWWNRSNEKLTSGGFVPLCYFSDGFNYAGPVWWNHGAAGELKSGGFFPLCYFSDSFNYAALAYWNRESGQLTSGGFLPVAMIGDSFCLAGPVWWIRNAGVGGVLPLAYWNRDFGLVGPVWWGFDEERRWNRGGFFPLVGWHEDLRYIGPVWWRKSSDCYGFFPFAKNNNEGNYFLPFYVYQNISTLTSLNIGGLLFHASVRNSTEADEKQLTYLHLMWPLFSWERMGEANKWHLFPLVSWAPEQAGKPGIGLYSRSRDGWGVVSPLFFQLIRETATTEAQEIGIPEDTLPLTMTDQIAYLPLKWQSRFWLVGTNGRQAGIARVWKSGKIHPSPRWFQSLEKAALNHQVSPAFAEEFKTFFPNTEFPKSEEAYHQVMEEAVRNYTEEKSYYDHRLLAGLLYWNVELGDEYGRSVLAFLWRDSLLRGERSTSLLGWLYRSTENVETEETSAGFGLYRFEAKPDMRETRILGGFFYRATHVGDASEYRVFPFVSRKSEPGRSRWSFLGPFLSFKDDHGKRSGRILFIPWGEE